MELTYLELKVVLFILGCCVPQKMSPPSRRFKVCRRGHTDQWCKKEIHLFDLRINTELSASTVFLPYDSFTSFRTIGDVDRLRVRVGERHLELLLRHRGICPQGCGRQCIRCG